MKSWVFIAILLSLISGGAYYYYATTQTRIENLTKQNSSLEASNRTLIEVNQTNLDTIDELNSSFDRVREDFERVQSDFQEIRRQNNELRERLGRHDIGALAAARPQLVERTINNASQNALRCFELLSGSPLTESELNATNARQFNSECPFLWPHTDQ